MKSTSPLTSNDKLVFVCGASRTGTTLACALLDSHQDIKMLSEFIFPVAISLADLIEWLDTVDVKTPAHADYTIAAADSKKLLPFVRRTGLSTTELSAFARGRELDALNGQISSFNDRLYFSVKLARQVLNIESEAMLFGFKLNNSQIFAASEIFPQARFLVVARDPATTVASQIRHDMSAGVDFSENVLQNYYGEYARFIDAYPDRSEAVNLELLSRAPGRGLANFLLKCLNLSCGLADPADVSKSSIIERGHKNSASLRSGIRVIDVEAETELGLSPATERIMSRFAALRQKFPASRYGKSFEHKRKLAKDQYIELIQRASDNREVLTLRDLNRHCRERNEADRVAFVRHDIDHDLDNAVTFAELDASMGIKATYCVLHDAPYYGKFDRNRMRYEINDYCVESIQYIQSLGHEINLHNNLLVMAGREGINPYSVLEHELESWWNHGVAICGTSTHGDRLCKEFRFRNWELFEECDLKSDGNLYVQMKIVDEDRACRSVVAKRCTPMSVFSLEYEAYDFPKTVYVSDSGGNIKEYENVRGHSRKRELYADYNIFGVLTHPIWWNLNG